MSSVLNNLLTLLSDKPLLGVFAIITFTALAVSFFYAFYKTIDRVIQILIEKKKIKVGKGGLEVEDKESPSSIHSEENLITLILDLQTAYFKYNCESQDVRKRLLDDQLKKFKTELRKYINNIRDIYLTRIKEEVYSTYTTLFSYWFESVFEVTQDDISSILERNHLRFKTSEEFEDVIRQCYDSTFGEVLTDVERAPEFVKEKEILRIILISEKNQYRVYLETSLQYAKKLSCNAAIRYTEIESKFTETKENILKRTFPQVELSKIMEQTKNV